MGNKYKEIEIFILKDTKMCLSILYYITFIVNKKFSTDFLKMINIKYHWAEQYHLLLTTFSNHECKLSHSR